MCQEVEFGLSLEEDSKPSEGLGFPRNGAVDLNQVKPGRSPMWASSPQDGASPCLPILSASQDALDFKLMSIGTKSKDLEPGKDSSLP